MPFLHGFGTDFLDENGGLRLGCKKSVLQCPAFQVLVLILRHVIEKHHQLRENQPYNSPRSDSGTDFLDEKGGLHLGCRKSVLKCPAFQILVLILRHVIEK